MHRTRNYFASVANNLHSSYLGKEKFFFIVTRNMYINQGFDVKFRRVKSFLKTLYDTIQLLCEHVRPSGKCNFCMVEFELNAHQLHRFGRQLRKLFRMTSSNWKGRKQRGEKTWTQVLGTRK